MQSTIYYFCDDFGYDTIINTLAVDAMRIRLRESNNEKEFRKLYEEYYAPFCLYAKRFINDMTVCEDLVSDVFVSLWDKRDSIELKKETATAYLKHMEYEWNYNEFCQKQSPIYATETDSVYTLNELYDMLYKTLQRLPENYRIVFIKSFFEGKTHAEIAQDMNLSVKSINRYKQKTMELLREELKEYLPVLLLIILQHRL